MDVSTNLKFLSGTLSFVTSVNILDKSSMVGLADCQSFDMNILPKHSLQWDTAPQDQLAPSFEDGSMKI